MKALGRICFFILFCAALDCSTKRPAPAPTPQPTTMSAGVSPIIPASWRQAAWDIDPQNSLGTSSDGNTCTSSSDACLTWGRVVQLLGTTSPQLQQPTTFYLLSSQTLNVDPIFFTPQLANGAQAILLGSLTTACTGTAGTVTPKSRGAPGALLQVASMPSCAAAKSLVLDTTRNSYAFVFSMLGSTATMEQPVPASSITTIGFPVQAIDNSWATGDALTVYTLPTANLKQWAPNGGDVTSGGAPTLSWVQWVNVTDTSGSGASVYPSVAEGAITVFSSDLFSGRLYLPNNVGRGSGIYIWGCDITGLLSPATSSAQMLAGAARGNITSYSDYFQIDGDTIVPFLTVESGIVWASTLYSTGVIRVLTGTLHLFNNPFTGNGVGQIWGSYNFSVDQNSNVWNASGSYVSSITTTGGLGFAEQYGSNNACAVNISTGVWTCPITVNQANIDANNGLQQPETNARFCINN